MNTFHHHTLLLLLLDKKRRVSRLLHYLSPSIKEMREATFIIASFFLFKLMDLLWFKNSAISWPVLWWKWLCSYQHLWIWVWRVDFLPHYFHSLVFDFDFSRVPHFLWNQLGMVVVGDYAPLDTSNNNLSNVQIEIYSFCTITLDQIII